MYTKADLMDDELLIRIQATITEKNLDCKLMEQRLSDCKIEEILLAFKLDRNSIFPLSTWKT